MEKEWEKASRLLELYGPRIVYALVILVAGFWMINLLVRFTGRLLERGRIDVSLRSFLKQAMKFILKILVIITAASALGIPTTSFIAVLSALGLAVGLALKDNLANLAGGIIILLFRPFNAGDFIDVQNVSGTVREIRLIYTYLNTIDNRLVLIPNGELANSKITNYSVEQERRLDLTFAVSYRESIEKVRRVLNGIVGAHPLIYKDPPPLIRVSRHGEFALHYMVRAWCKNQDFLTVTYDLLESVKTAFDAEGILIPHSLFESSEEMRKVKEPKDNSPSQVQ